MSSVPGSAPDKDACPEKARLLREYDHAVGEYARHVMVLTASGHTRQDSQSVKEQTEELRSKTDAARAALDQHTEEHGC